MLRHLSHACLRAMMVALPLWGLSPGVQADELRLGGTGGALELLKQLAGAYAAANPGVKPEVTPGLGSSGGIRAISDGVLELAVSGRPLNASEAAKGIIQIGFLRTPFVLAAARRSAEGFRSSELARLVGAEGATWSDGTPIRFILRPKSDSDTLLLNESFEGMSAALEQRRQRGDLPLASTGQDNVEIAEREPGALVALTLAQLTTERLRLHAARIDGIEPTMENFRSGTYRYGKTWYLVFPVNPSPLTERFIAFIRSPAAADILRDADCLPISR